MKFNVPQTILSAEGLNDVRVGNVYSSKGGKNTAFWVVVGVNGDSVHLMGINREGQITSTQSYGKWVFEGSGAYNKGRPILGFVEGLDELVFDVQWGAV